MKLKINKLLPYSQQNKKQKTQIANINGKNYFLSPYALDKSNFAGIIIPLQFICTMPDQNSDYQYLKCTIRVDSLDFKETVCSGDMAFKDIKRNDNKRDFLFQFVPPYKGAYTINISLYYKQKYFIQTTQPPQQINENSIIKLNCEDPFQLQQNIIYEQKPSSISFPLFVQYTLTNKLKDTFLQIAMNFDSENFDYRFLNNEKSIKIGGGQTYFIMLQVYQKSSVNKLEIMFGEKGLAIGSLWLFQGKNRVERKLSLKPGYKNLLFRAETIDKKVAKKDIVDVKIKFINTYDIDYKIGPIRININQNEIPPGIRLLKISRDVIDLTKNKEQIITLTMICLRSGFFQFRGITLNIKDKANPKEDRILKYINDLSLIVENEEEEKKNMLMERTSSIQVDSLI